MATKSMVKVFIGYAREDEGTAFRLYQDLEKAGLDPWLDKEKLLPGQAWKTAISCAVKESSFFLALLSSKSLTKRGFFRRELSMAFEVLSEVPPTEVFLIPVRIDDCRPEDERIKDLHWADLFPSYEKGLERILRVLAKDSGSKEAEIQQQKQGTASPAAQSLPGKGIGSNPAAGEVWVERVTGMEFVWVPGGAFRMGSPNSEKERYDDEGPVHEVHVEGFWMGKYPVVQREWEKVMGSNPSRFKLGERYPVEQVSWEGAQEFIRKLVSLTGTTHLYRLPSEAEWEYACRAGTRTRFYTGEAESDLDRAGWYAANSNNQTHPVGEKEPNAFGLYDMHGNVWEWVEDDWHKDYEGAPVDGRAWIDNPRASGRVIRGGGWLVHARFCRASRRVRIVPSFRYDLLGFRVALVPPGKKAS